MHICGNDIMNVCMSITIMTIILRRLKRERESGSGRRGNSRMKKNMKNKYKQRMVMRNGRKNQKMH